MLAGLVRRNLNYLIQREARARDIGREARELIPKDQRVSFGSRLSRSPFFAPASGSLAEPHRHSPSYCHRVK